MVNSNYLIGYSRSHIISIKKVLRRLFNIAIKKDIIKYNPTDDLVLPFCIEHERRTITDDERRLLYQVGDDFTPYLLRHTFCTDCQNAGVPINIAKEFMGHYDVNTTAKIYTHTTDEMCELCRRKLNDYYSNQFSKK